MGTSSFEISAVNPFSLEEGDSQSNTPIIPISADRYTLVPITSIPSSSNRIRTPQPGYIYVDSVKAKYTALIYDESMSGEYDGVVILGPSTQFDENAKKHTGKLYLVEEAANIILYHYDGKQWCSISRGKVAALEALRFLEFEEGENGHAFVIEMVTSFYGFRLLKGQLEDLNLTELDAPGLKDAIIEQIAADMSGNRKRQRDPVVIIHNEPMHKRKKVDTGTGPQRCLEDEFQKIAVASEPVESDSEIDIFASLPVITESDQMAALSPLGSVIDLMDLAQPVSPLQLENSVQTIHSQPSPLNSGDTLCTARVSSGLGLAQYSLGPAQNHFNFWETQKSNTEIDISIGNPLVENPPAAEENAVNELIARVEQGDTTAYRQYATLLETGSSGVEKNEGLAAYFFDLAAEAEEQQVVEGRWSPAL